MNKKPSDGELKVIDAIIKTYFDDLKYVHDITFDDINTVIYSAAVTIKEYLKDVKYAKVHKEEPMEPKWIQNLDNKTKRLRRAYLIQSSYCHVLLITATLSINIEFAKGYNINLEM